MMYIKGETPPLAYETLKDALKRAEKVAPTLCADSKLIVLAAEAHLATLPRPLPKQYRVSYYEGLVKLFWSDGWKTRAEAADSMVKCIMRGHDNVLIEEYPKEPTQQNKLSDLPQAATRCEHANDRV